MVGELSWPRRVALFAGVVAAAVLLTAPGAEAAGCDKAPTPSMPHRGITGVLIDPPASPPTSAGGEVSRFEVYGPSGQFFTHQDGCAQAIGDALTGGAVTSGQEATSGQILANWIMLAPEWGTAAAASLASAAFDTSGWLSVLDPVWASIGGALKAAVTEPFAPIVAIIVLLVLALALTKGRVSAFAGTFAVTLAATGLLVLGGSYPAAAGRMADEVIVDTTTELRSAINGTSSDDPGVAMIGALSDRIIYRSWCAGMFGTAESITASRYCPDLYDASHLTWVESARAERDPEALKSIVETKQAAWTATVGEIEEADPDAYDNITGKNGSNRVGQAANALVAWIVALPLIFVSLVLVVAAFFIVRVVVVFLPILALVMVVPRFHHLLPSVGATVGAAVINSVIFSAVASVTAVVTTRIMTTEGLPWAVRLLLCLAFTVVVWLATKPFRKLTRMVSNWDPARDLGKFGDKIAGSIRSTLTTAAGTAVGATAASVGESWRAGGAGEQRYEPSTREPQLYRRTFPRPDEAPPVTREPHPLPAGSTPTPAIAAHPAEYALPGAPSDTPHQSRPDQDATTTRPAGVTDHPGPITVDGVTVHDRRDPTARDVREFDRDGEGVYLVFDPEAGLVESSDEDAEASA